MVTNWIICYCLYINNIRTLKVLFLYTLICVSNNVVSQAHFMKLKQDISDK